MRRSTDRILVTHVGALPGPSSLWTSQVADSDLLASEVASVIKKQRSAGVDFVNEGELTKGGSWVGFVNSRISGYQPAKEQRATRELLLGSPDWQEFAEYYNDRLMAGTLFEETGKAPAASMAAVLDWECVAPLEYVGHQALTASIKAIKENLGTGSAADAFVTSTAPMSIEVGRVNRHYKSDEDYVNALAEVLRVEYEGIAAAGLQLQIDDAWMAALWDRIGIPMGMSSYKKHCMMRIEALNYALRNIPESQIRYHLCWGSWHGPHTCDIPMPDIVDLMLAIKAQIYLFEAANARHEHEVSVWEDVKLPADKILAPGCVSHATAVVEHPDLVAMRIKRFAKLVGRENVIASTDCGLGLRCHPQIAWSKLKALSEGAGRASKQLW